jgi:hypothetical protein
MMFLIIPKPNPMPLFLVVNLGSKIRLISSGLIPIPLSSTIIKTLLLSFYRYKYGFPSCCSESIEWHFNQISDDSD